VQKTPESEIYYEYSLIVAHTFTRLKKIIRFIKRKSRWDLQNLHSQQAKVQDALEEIL